MAIKKKSKKSPVKKSKRAPVRVYIDTETTSLEDSRKGKPPRVRAVVNAGDLIAMICKAASERWPEDKSRPGIQIAHIPNERGEIFSVPVETATGMFEGTARGEAKPARWYVALHRYSGLMGEGRRVEFKTDSDDLDLALLDVARHVAPSAPVEHARKDLAKLISGWISLACLALFVLFGTSACAGQVVDAPTPAPSSSIGSCEMLDESPNERIFAFSEGATVSIPVGAECKSLGGGVFTCWPDACLNAPYSGSCPHCYGDGE